MSNVEMKTDSGALGFWLTAYTCIPIYTLAIPLYVKLVIK